MHFAKTKYSMYSVIFFMLVVLLTVPAVRAEAGVPDVSEVMVTDVTTRSFSVVWLANEPSIPDLEVYDDSCTNITSSVIIDPMPVESGDPALEGADKTASMEALREGAENKGIMKVRVNGLDANMVYYYQTVTTSKSTSDTVFSPDSGNCTALNEVTTELLTVRTKTDGTDIIPFSNDLIQMVLYLSDGSTPAEGTLLIADVDGCNYPVSAFVGDGVPAPYALVDLNNLFSELNNESLEVSGSEIIKLLHLRGFGDKRTRGYAVPENTQLASVLDPDLLSQSVHLMPDWNIISFQLELEDNDVASVFSSVMGSLDVIWAYNAESGSWQTYDTSIPPMFNDLKTIDPNVGYQIKMKAEADLTIEGAWQMDPVVLYADWNLSGYRSLETADIAQAIGDIAGVLDVIWAYDAVTASWQTYDTSIPPMFNDLKKIDPTKGYMIRMLDQTDW